MNINNNKIHKQKQITMSLDFSNFDVGIHF